MLLGKKAQSIAFWTASFYILFTLIALSLHKWDPLWFAWQGPRFRDLIPGARTGYDGQFFYYLAAWGWDAIPHLDNAPYRLQRIGYPLLVRAITLGRTSLIPITLILTNITAITLTTALIAQQFIKDNINPRYALTYALYTGTFFAFSRGVAEPLAYCLVTIATLLHFRGNRWLAICIFAYAALTKEITLLFPIGIGISELLKRNVTTALTLGFIPIPLIIWQIVIQNRTGFFPFNAGTPSLRTIPLQGVLPHLSREPGMLTGFVMVALPSLALALFALYLLKIDHKNPLAIILLIHAIFVMLLPPDVYNHMMHAGRNAAGMILATILLFPQLPAPIRPLTALYWTIPTFLWLIPIIRWEHDNVLNPLTNLI